MAGNNNTKNDSTQKIVTKYDKKMAKRKAGLMRLLPTS